MLCEVRTGFLCPRKLCRIHSEVRLLGFEASAKLRCAGSPAHHQSSECEKTKDRTL